MYIYLYIYFIYKHIFYVHVYSVINWLKINYNYYEISVIFCIVVENFLLIFCHL